MDYRGDFRGLSRDVKSVMRFMSSSGGEADFLTIRAGTGEEYRFIQDTGLMPEIKDEEIFGA